MIFSPPWSLLVKLFHKLNKENCHCLRVVVYLKKRKEHLAASVQGGDHRNSWSNLCFRNRVRRSRKSPFSTSKITHSEPSFIHINNSLFVEVQVQEYLGKLLSQHKIPDRVGRYGYWNHLLEAHLQSMSHYHQDIVLLEQLLSLFLDFLLNKFHRINKCIFSLHLIESFFHCLRLGRCFLSSVNKLFKKSWIFSTFLDNV